MSGTAFSVDELATCLIAIKQKSPIRQQHAPRASYTRRRIDWLVTYSAASQVDFSSLDISALRRTASAKDIASGAAPSLRSPCLLRKNAGACVGPASIA